jgi:hypothetical protein
LVGDPLVEAKRSCCFWETNRQEKKKAVNGGTATDLAAGTIEKQSEIQKMLPDSKQKIAAFEQQLAQKDQLLEQCKLQILRQEAHIRELIESSSWRVTRPLRLAYEIMLKLRRKSSSK